MKGATTFPLAVFDVRPRARAGRARADHGDAGAADDVLGAAGPPATATPICRVAAHRLRRRVDGPGRAVRRMRAELPFERVTTGYGITEAPRCARSPRPTTTRGRRGLERRAPIPDIEIRSSTIGTVARRARGAARPGAQRDVRLLPRPGRDRRGDRARRVAAHRRHRGPGRATAISGSPTARRTSTSSGGFNVSPAEVERPVRRDGRDRAGRGGGHPRRSPR